MAQKFIDKNIKIIIKLIPRIPKERSDRKNENINAMIAKILIKRKNLVSRENVIYQRVLIEFKLIYKNVYGSNA